MVDIINLLAEKRRRIVTQKETYKREYENRILELDIEMARVNDAISSVNSVIQDMLCPDCGGTGEKRYTDAAGSRDYMTCPTCDGTGIMTCPTCGGAGIKQKGD